MTAAVHSPASFTRELNQQFKSRGFRCVVGVIGSFISVRIEDPAHMVTVWDAQEIEAAAGRAFYTAGLVTSERCAGGIRHWMDGVVLTWSMS